MNGDAAREQADGAEDRQLQHLCRRGTAEALADVEDVGDDEDDEDRRLGHDEAGHADRAAIGQRPRRLDSPVDQQLRLTVFIIRSPSPDLPDVSGPTRAGGC